MTTNLRELAGQSRTVAVPVGDETFILKRLTIEKLAEATTVLQAKRHQRFLKATRAYPIPPETMAKTLADIACKPVTLLDVCDDWEGRLWLITNAFAAAGFKGGPLAVKAAIADVTLNELAEMIDAITGIPLYSGASDDGSDPTTSSGSSPPGTPSGSS